MHPEQNHKPSNRNQKRQTRLDAGERVAVELGRVGDLEVRRVVGVGQEEWRMSPLLVDREEDVLGDRRRGERRGFVPGERRVWVGERRGFILVGECKTFVLGDRGRF